MQKAMVVLVAGVLSAAALIPACKETKARQKNGVSAKADTLAGIDLVKRGGYLVNAMLCDDCHSPKTMGPNGPEIIPDRRLSGFTAGGKLPAFDSSEIRKGWVLFGPDFTAAVGPWGASFAGNLTSDATGIGNWSFEQFKKAITEGKYKGLDAARELLPPMPWPNFSKVADDDLRAIFAFLKSTKPVKNIVPPPMSFEELSKKSSSHN